MQIILILLLLLIIFGGGFGTYYGYNRWGMAGGARRPDRVTNQPPKPRGECGYSPRWLFSTRSGHPMAHPPHKPKPKDDPKPKTESKPVPPVDDDEPKPHDEGDDSKRDKDSAPEPD